MVNKHSFQYWRDAGCSEAIWASSTGDLKTLEKLVADQKDIETGDYDRRTPLHLASAEGHTDVVKFLLDHGVEPSPDRWGGYPISDAKAGDLIISLSIIQTRIMLLVIHQDLLIHL